ncbi:MAG: enoyl-CoA hydratase/isomerase family protein [Caulobacterales bacterium]
MTKKYETIETKLDGWIFEIILNQPQSHNGIGYVMHHELKEAFLSVRDMPEVRAVVFGSTGKSFSAGGDFELMLAHHVDHEKRRAMEPEARELIMSVGDCPIPVVTAVQGDAVGLGATLLLATDAVVASKTVRISDPHVVVGLVAGDGGCVVWPLSTSFLRAKRYLLTGDRIKAEDALAMGLVTDLVEAPEDALPAARALAARIAAQPPLAVKGTKRAFNQIFRQRMDAVFDFGLSLEMETFTTNDMVEAISAFREKRPPKYNGN